MSKRAQEKFEENMRDIASSYRARDDRGVLTLDKHSRKAEESIETPKKKRKKSSSQHNKKKHRKEKRKHKKHSRKKRKHKSKKYEKVKSGAHTSDKTKNSSKEESEIKPGKRIKPIYVVWILIALVIAVLMFLTQPESDRVIIENETITTQANVEVTNQERVLLSIEDEISNIEDTIGEEVEIQGFLSHSLGDGDSGVHIYEIRDDFDNSIELESLSQNQRSLFDRTRVTSESFLVIGTIAKSLGVPVIRVESIVPADFEYKETIGMQSEDTQEVRQINVTIVDNRTRWQRLQQLFFSDCEDGTPSGTCSEIAPNYCSRGELIEKPTTCGCAEGFRLYERKCIAEITCSDGTLSPECSDEKPLMCDQGELVQAASSCGCPDGYRQNGESCEEIMYCDDGTEYGFCSDEKPLKCVRGELVEQASECGCSGDDVKSGNKCISKYMVDEQTIELPYTLRGEVGIIEFDVYGGLHDYLADKPRSYYCNPVCPSDKELEMRFIDESQQDKALRYLADLIQEETENKDDQARIAISLVQTVPYDWEGFTRDSLNNRYPYEVLFDEAGVCGEKSRLISYLLRELGFGTALFAYEVESHQAVGILCDEEYAYAGSNYCFIESTAPTLITDSTGDYVGIGRLSEPSAVYVVADGREFDASEEYADANELLRLQQIAKSNDNYLSQRQYSRWQDLVDKYGIQTE